MVIRRTNGKDAVAESSRRQATKSVLGYGKGWSEGDKVHVFFPLEYREDGIKIFSSSRWGHELDKALKANRFFVPTTSIINEMGKPDEPDILYKLQKICLAYQKADKNRQMIEVSNSKDMGQAEQMEKINEIVKEFENQRPLIGKLKLKLTTEVVMIHLKEVERDGKTAEAPNKDKMFHLQRELSDEHISYLNNIIAKGEEVALHEDLGVIEVRYEYPVLNDRSKAGQAKPIAVKAEDSLLVKYPAYKTEIISRIQKIPDNGDVLDARNRDFEKVDPTAFANKVTAIFKKNADTFNSLDEADRSILFSNALAIRDIGLKFKGELGEIMEQKIAEAEEAAKEEVAPDIEAIFNEEVEQAIEEVATDETLDIESLSELEE